MGQAQAGGREIGERRVEINLAPIEVPTAEEWVEDPEKAQRKQNGHDAQAGFVYSPAAHAGFFAASGTGKTRMGCLKLTDLAIEMGKVPPSVWAQWNQTPYMIAGAPTYKMLKKVLEPTLLQVIPNELIQVYHQSDGYVQLRNGIRIWLSSCEDPTYLYGPTLLGYLLDEVCRMEEEIWDVMTFRLRGPLPDGLNAQRQGFVTGTPYGLPHWTYDLWGDPMRETRMEPPPVTNTEDYPWWNMSIYDNPYQSPADIARWEARYGGTAKGRQEMLGQWVAEGEGRLFQPEWFGRFDRLPDDIFLLVDSWDTASTLHEWSTWTVGQTWAITTDYNYYLLNMFRAKLEYPDVKVAIKENARFLYGHPVDAPRAVIIEDKGAGQHAIQELRREGINLVAFKPRNRDKHDRASQASVPVSEGRVHLPSQDFAARHKLEWLRDFEREVFNIPYAGSWDIVDALTQFIIWAEVGRLRGRLRAVELEPIEVTPAMSRECVRV